MNMCWAGQIGAIAAAAKASVCTPSSSRDELLKLPPWLISFMCDVVCSDSSYRRPSHACRQSLSLMPASSPPCGATADAPDAAIPATAPISAGSSRMPSWMSRTPASPSAAMVCKPSPSRLRIARSSSLKLTVSFAAIFCPWSYSFSPVLDAELDHFNVSSVHPHLAYKSPIMMCLSHAGLPLLLCRLFYSV